MGWTLCVPDGKPLVIFTTAYSEYAVEGFKVDALDYLLKPFGFQDFLKAVDKAYKWWEFRTKGHGTVAPPSTPSELSFNDGTLFVKSDYRVTRINLQILNILRGMSEYVRIFVEGEAKPIMPLLSMKRLEETLPPSQFMRAISILNCQFEKITEVPRLRIVLERPIFR